MYRKSNMPLYEFKCNKCGAEFEAKQSLEEFERGELPKREGCADECKVERVISKLKTVSSSWKNWRT